MNLNSVQFFSNHFNQKIYRSWLSGLYHPVTNGIFRSAHVLALLLSCVLDEEEKYSLQELNILSSFGKEKSKIERL